MEEHKEKGRSKAMKSFFVEIEFSTSRFERNQAPKVSIYYLFVLVDLVVLVCFLIYLLDGLFDLNATTPKTGIWNGLGTV